MKCDICENRSTYIKKHDHTYIIKGKEIHFSAQRRFCDKCNSIVYDAELDNKVTEIAIALYNELYGVSKEDIINLRKKYNLSMDLFSKIIGCAKKTLVSYEKGKSIPNDCYLIILKSLLAKPETILTLIEANKEQFTQKEINKINSKLPEFLPYNTKQLNNIVEDDPNEFNGYTSFSKEKIYNIILFFAETLVYKTKLLKEMFYADFLCYKETCKSMTGLEYSKLPLGPVPDQFEEILKQCILDDIINYETIFKNQYECHKITAKNKFDASLFTMGEIEILKKIKNQFENFNSSDIVDFSHKEKAFIETSYYNRISYDFAFDIDSIK